MKRKALAVILCACIVLTSFIFPDNVKADDTISGSCGNSATYELNLTTGELKIIGSGEMSNYSSSSLAPWGSYTYRAKVKKITINEGITGIGNYAFYNCLNATSVSIPNTVTSIGVNAFQSCTNLQSVALPGSVKSISIMAFMDCTGLTSFTMTDNVKSIGEAAFQNCTSLGSITLSNNLTSIDNQVFFGCTQLSSITIPDSVTSIGESAFKGCSNLSTVNMGLGVSSIGKYAFSNCSKLTSVDISYGVKSILAKTFEYCSSLKSVYIPGSVTSISTTAFYICSSLSEIRGSKGSYAETYASSYGYTFTEYSTGGGSGSDDEKDADYTAVDAAIAKVPSDLSIYTDETVAAVNAAVNAVVRGKKASEQSVVDGYATAINNAVAGLVEKPVEELTISATKIETDKIVTFTAEATGGKGDYTYKFIVYNKTTKQWGLIQNFSGNNTCTWTKGSVGDRDFYVDVKDSEGNVVRSNAINVVIEEQKPVITLTGKETVTPGERVTLTAQTTLGDECTFKFIIYNPATDQWFKLQDYTTNNEYVWTAGLDGTRQFYVDVKDASGNVTRSKVFNVKIEENNSKVLVVKATVSTTSPTVGEKVTFTAQAIGGEAGYTYKMVVYNRTTKQWGLVQNFSANNIITWIAGSVGDREFYIDVKDASGNVVRSTMMNVATE
ncbi:MAG: leucine-rich repeat protein [Lachnospira sp.]